MKPSEIARLLPGVFQRTIHPGSPLLALLEVMELLQAPAEEILENLDGFFDPTPMFFAAQSWQTLVNNPSGPSVTILDEVVRLMWTDNEGKDYFIWWRAAADLKIKSIPRPEGFPENTLSADPLHARLLNLEKAHRLPLCCWPLIMKTV